MNRYIGYNQPRLDGREKVTGAACFTHDIILPGMLHAKVLRSPHAHARIISVDTRAALALPGVEAVVCKDNTPGTPYNSSAFAAIAQHMYDPVLDQRLFDDKVRFVGDEVAAVAAVSEKIAARALELIKVAYEILPAVFDPFSALAEDSVEIHESRFGKNLAAEPSRLGAGDFERGWAESDVTFEATVKLPVQKQVPLETSAALAHYKANGELTVYSTTQTIHPVKRIIAQVFGMRESMIRVLNPPYIGGGFGQRSGLSAKAELISVALSKQCRKPVKLVYDRREDMAATDSRHSGYITVRLGAKKDGSFHALELNPVLNTGAYCSWGGTVSSKIHTFAANTYRVPHTRHFGRAVYTNILPAGAMRGFGNPQAMFAMETAVDGIAKQLGRDPVDLRLQNIIRVGDQWELPFPCVSSALASCVEQAKQAIGWDHKRGRTQSGPIRRGVGIAVGRHVSASDQLSGVYLRAEADGSLHLATGLSEMGNGVGSALAQILAETMTIGIEMIHLTIGDTDMSPFDIGGHSTRCLYDKGLCTIAAAQTLIAEMRAYAAIQWRVEPEQITLQDGVFHTADCNWNLSQLAFHAHRHGKRFETIGRAQSGTTVPWHAHAAEVEVDTQTGIVRVLKVAAAHDVGQAINPQVVEGQIEGGVLQGIGYALREEMTFDGEGRLYNDDIHKYMLLTAGDVPEIVPLIVMADDPLGPYGAKGVGECSIVPTAPAIAAAVEDAVGIRFLELPMTPVRVLEALRRQQEDH